MNTPNSMPERTPYAPKPGIWEKIMRGARTALAVLGLGSAVGTGIVAMTPPSHAIPPTVGGGTTTTTTTKYPPKRDSDRSSRDAGSTEEDTAVTSPDTAGTNSAEDVGPTNANDGSTTDTEEGGEPTNAVGERTKMLNDLKMTEVEFEELLKQTEMTKESFIEAIGMAMNTGILSDLSDLRKLQTGEMDEAIKGKLKKIVSVLAIRLQVPLTEDDLAGVVEQFEEISRDKKSEETDWKTWMIVVLGALVLLFGAKSMKQARKTDALAAQLIRAGKISSDPTDDEPEDDES